MKHGAFQIRKTIHLLKMDCMNNSRVCSLVCVCEFKVERRSETSWGERGLQDLIGCFDQFSF